MPPRGGWASFLSVQLCFVCEDFKLLCCTVQHGLTSYRSFERKLLFLLALCHMVPYWKIVGFWDVVGFRGDIWNFSKSNEKFVAGSLCSLMSILGFLKMEKVSLWKEVKIYLETKSYTQETIKKTNVSAEVLIYVVTDGRDHRKPGSSMIRLGKWWLRNLL